MKQIAITCDNYKVENYRKRLIKEGFKLAVDTNLYGYSDVHIFKIECTDAEYKNTCEKLRTVLTQLEIEIKQSN